MKILGMTAVGILAANTAFAANFEHANCQLITSVLSAQEAAAKGYTSAVYSVVDSKGKKHSLALKDVSRLVKKGNLAYEKETALSDLETRLSSLSLEPRLNFDLVLSNGEKLISKVDELRSPVLSMDIPNFAVGNTEKVRLEIGVELSQYSVDAENAHWFFLKKTPVQQTVVFKSEVFSFSKLAKEVLAKKVAGSEEEVLLRLIANDDVQEIENILKENESFKDILNFLKLALVEHLYVKTTGQPMDVESLLKAGVPTCAVAKK